MWNGKVGFALLANWAEPSNPNVQADYTARDHWLTDTIGWFAGPLTSGDYPSSMRKRYGDMLPTFTSDEMKDMMGACDFWAIDHFTTFLVSMFVTEMLWQMGTPYFSAM